MLQTAEVVELNKYRNLRIINHRFEQYHQYLQVEQLPYILGNCHYHILVSAHSNEQFVNVLITNQFSYKKRQMAEIGFANCAFVFSMDKFPFAVESALILGNKVHIYYSQNRKSYCIEQLQAGALADEIFTRVTNREYYKTVDDMIFGVNQQRPAKILQYHFRKE